MSMAARPPKGRLWAAGVHLAISALIATVVVSTMYFVWYPWPFFGAMGGNNLAMLIVGVDVVLGPLVTLIIFNRAKGGWLTFDLCVIGALQASALAWGVHIVAEARPVYMVFSIDRFELTARYQIADAELARVKRPEFASIPLGPPRTVGARLPTDSGEQMRILGSAVAGNDLSTFPQHFVPYVEVAATAVAKSRPLAELRGRSPEAPALLAKALADIGRAEADVRWLALKGRVKDAAVLVDAKTGAVLGFVEIYPW